MPGLPSGTVTFLFTNIEGSTRLWEDHPEAMRLALARHDALLRAAIEEHDGHVFKTIGDAFCAAFHTDLDALNAALAVHLALASEPWPEPIMIKVRMALHTGAAEARDNDYFGQPLNRVARLLAAGHGRQVLLSQATQELTRDALPPSATLKTLGEHRLRDLNRPETIYQLLHPDLPAEFPPLKSLDQFPNNLPQQLTSFIGREKEMDQTKGLLAKTRLLTLTGSGGCGKTRLALQVAAEMLEQYSDGVWLVELAPLSEPALAPQEVAAALRVTEQTGQTLLQTLIDYLEPKRLLLVLDNCEHLLSACVPLCDALLRACSKLTILVTTREGLGIAGEQTYRVPSLSLPDPGQALTIEQIHQYEAVRLFTVRAVSSKADFVITNASAPALAAVCHRLDGIPLAIELAAARVRNLTVEEINSRLDHRFRLLTGGSKTALPRQQTLRALIDWSYDLLTDQEKWLLCRLSVFAGGWTLEAAEQVGAGESEAEAAIEGWEVLDLLTSLVDKSMVIAEAQGQSMRYRLLETVRQYVRDRLEESGKPARVRSSHRDYFLALAEEIRPKLTGAEQAHWLSALEAEHDNLRQSLEFCLHDPGGGDQGLRLSAALQHFWWVRCHWSEGLAHFDAALQHPGAQAHTPARADALSGAGILAYEHGDYGAADVHVQNSLAIWRELDDRRKIATTLNSLGVLAMRRRDYSTARTHYEECLSLFRGLDNQNGIASAQMNLGLAALEQGDNAAAQSYSEQAVTFFRQLGHIHGIAQALTILSCAIRRQGDLATAQTLFEESLQRYREIGERRGIATALHNLGGLAVAQGDYATGCTLLEESLRLSSELGYRSLTADTLAGFATASLAHAEEARAVQLLGAVAALRESIETPLPPSQEETYAAQLAQARSALGDAVFIAAFEKGRSMPLDQAVEYALAKSE